ncbi:YraN family protein [Magnetococcales bacterium HHB-1]
MFFKKGGLMQRFSEDGGDETDRARATDERQQLGGYGELLAEKHLIAQGCQIVDRNFRVRGGEIDLIALDGETLLFAEVKTRRGGGHPGEAIHKRKQQQLFRIAQYFLHKFPVYSDAYCRFDALLVFNQKRSGWRVLWLKDAFRPGW